MKWFKHDSDASNDAKLRKVRHKYGASGYAVYWYCLELVARNVDKHNLTFELEHDAELIADDFKLSHDLVQEMMMFMVNIGLFENSQGVITCLKMASRTDEYTYKIIKNLTSVPTVSRQNPEKSELIEEKRREEKRTEEINTNTGKPKRTVFKKPSIADVKEYCLLRSNVVDAERFFDYYESNGWKVGKNSMKDWKASVRTWEKNNDTRGKQGISAKPDNSATRHHDRLKAQYAKAIADELGD